MKIKPHTFTVEQASQQTPAMARLWNASIHSRVLWQKLIPILPPYLHNQLQPASFEDGIWSLLATNATIASKAKQYLPDWLVHLRRHHPLLSTIRISVAINRTMQ